MNTELNILKQISENKGKASVQLIAKVLRMRSDYIRYLCLELIKKGLIKKLKGRDWYKITRRGEKEIGKPTRKPPKKHIFAKKKMRRRLKQGPKRKLKKKLKKKVLKKKIRPKVKKKAKKKKIEKPVRKRPKTKAKKAATQPKQKIKRPRMFPEKGVSKSETVLKEETPHLEEPEASKRIETQTSSKTNRMTKIFKTLFGIKGD